MIRYNDYSQPISRGFLPKVFGWMAAGLGISALTCFYTSPEVNPLAYNFVTENIILLLFATLGIAVLYQWTWARLNFVTSLFLFSTYSALNGAILSPIINQYTQASILHTFVVTAVTFIVMALYGYLTNEDLSSMGSILVMGLFGLVIAHCVGFFFPSRTLDIAISSLGVIIFTLFIAYDIQQIKRISHLESNSRGTLALIAALRLYLDVINLFLYILDFLGEKKRK